MRRILLSALFAVGVGLAGTVGASAAPLAGFTPAPATSPLVEQVQYYGYHHWHRWHRPFCRTERVCRIGRYGRRHCWVRRVCR